MFRNEQDDIKSDTHCLSEDTEFLKEYSTKFSTQLNGYGKKLSSFTTSIDGILENMSANNRVDINIEAETSELEATIQMKLDKATTDHVKTIDPFDMNI